MNIAIASILLLVGFLNFYPLIGLQGSARLAALYGLPVDGADLTILMRHRALMFGLVGGFIMSAAFVPEWRGLAFAAGFISMLGFVALAWAEGGYNGFVAKVVMADIVGSLALLVALVLHLSRTD
ncbi:MAG: hypothetical protein Q7S99_10845 [Parvibaculum sp.]|nr:hypothetical protein [Parvibaculum sp.]